MSQPNLDPLRRVVAGMLSEGMSRNEVILATRQSILIWALNQTNGIQVKAAELLHVDPHTVQREMGMTMVGMKRVPVTL